MMTNEPTGADLIAAVLNGVRAREGTKAARDVAVEMLHGLTAILHLEFGGDRLSDMLVNAAECAHVAVSERAVAHLG
jgi:hypothetical protein